MLTFNMIEHVRKNLISRIVAQAITIENGIAVIDLKQIEAIQRQIGLSSLEITEQDIIAAASLLDKPVRVGTFYINSGKTNVPEKDI